MTISPLRYRGYLKRQLGNILCVFAVCLAVTGVSSPVGAQGPKQAVDLTKRITDALGKAGETALKDKTFETIDALDRLANQLSKLSSLGPALALVGAGLDIIKIIENKPDATQRILAAIDELDTKIDETNQHVGRVEKRIVATIAYENLRTELSSRFSTIETAYDLWRELNDSGTPPERMRTNQKKIEQLISAIQVDAKTIADHCVGANQQANLFPTLDDYSTGDISVASSWATLVIGRLTQAALVNAYYESQSRPNGPLTPDEGRAILADPQQTLISNSFLHYIAVCNSAFQTARTALISTEIVHDNAINHLNNMLDNKVHSAEELGTQLKEKFPYHDWIIAIYKDVGGFDNHVFTTLNTIALLRHNVPGLGARNIVLHFSESAKTPVVREAVVKSFAAPYRESKKIAQNTCEFDECWLNTRATEAAGYYIYCAYRDSIALIGMKKCTQTWPMPPRKYDLRLILTEYQKAPFYLVGRLSATGKPDVFRSDNDISGFDLGRSLWTLQSSS